MGHKAGDAPRSWRSPKAWAGRQVKHLVHWPTKLKANLLAPRTLLGIVRENPAPRATLADLIISAGRRNEPPCRWILAHADNASASCTSDAPGRGSRTSISWSPAAVPAAQAAERAYATPRPCGPVADQRLREAAGIWAPRLAPPAPAVYRRPGRRQRRAGRAGSQGRHAAGARGERVRPSPGRVVAPQHQRAHPQAGVSALEAARGSHADVYRWSRDATENPYLGYLALAKLDHRTCEACRC